MGSLQPQQENAIMKICEDFAMASKNKIYAHYGEAILEARILAANIINIIKQSEVEL